MAFWFYIVMAIILFAFITLVRRWYDYSILFTIAIGFVVNANIFTASNVPIYLGNIVFAIDSILYTGFMFVVIICAREYGVRKAKILTSSCIAAILVSAGIEFLANVSAFGYSSEYLINTLSYVYSAFGTFVGVWLMLYIYQKLDALKTHVILNFVVSSIVMSFVNTSIFYGLTSLTVGSINTVWMVLLGSFLGKVICIILGLISYYINTHYWIPNDLKYKYVVKSCEIKEKEVNESGEEVYKEKSSKVKGADNGNKEKEEVEKKE